jgi:AraC-like DNA-binding protein
MNKKQAPARETARFWCDTSLQNLELLRANYITHVFAPHAHEGYAMGIIERGAQTFIYERHKTAVMPEGCVVMVNPDEVHIGKAATPDGWTYRMAYPAVTLVEAIAADLFGKTVQMPFFSIPVLWDNALFQQFLTMHRTLESPYSSQLARETTLAETLIQMIRRHADRRPAPRPTPREKIVMLKVQQYIVEHLAENFSLTELAQEAALHPCYLVRVFGNAFGLPPHAYQNQQRIERAKTLLLQGVPIATVAGLTGFADQSHLTRHFKRIVGVPPGQYRQL